MVKEQREGKVLVVMRMAVHPIQAALWNHRTRIKPEMTLRQIGAIVGVQSAQQIKHHLQRMVAMGTVDYIGGQYVFPEDKGAK